MKYPQGVKKNQSNVTRRNKEINHGQRGMTLENDLDKTNQFYLDTKRAIIHKKPTPVQIVDVDYPSRKKAKITEAYFKIPSTSDYNGLYKGKYIDFEAKETRNKTRFPLINIHAHQVEHMRACHNQGGIVFLIVKFTVHDEVYLYPFEHFSKHWDEFTGDGRKSITYADIKDESILLPIKYNPRYDYLAAVDEFYFE